MYGLSLIDTNPLLLRETPIWLIFVRSEFLLSSLSHLSFALNYSPLRFSSLSRIQVRIPSHSPSIPFSSLSLLFILFIFLVPISYTFIAHSEFWKQKCWLCLGLSKTNLDVPQKFYFPMWTDEVMTKLEKMCMKNFVTIFFFFSSTT